MNYRKQNENIVYNELGDITTHTRTDVYTTDNAEYHATYTTIDGALNSTIQVQIFKPQSTDANGVMYRMPIATLTLTNDSIAQNGMMPLSDDYPIYAAEFIEICNDVVARIAAEANPTENTESVDAVDDAEEIV